MNPVGTPTAPVELSGASGDLHRTGVLLGSALFVFITTDTPVSSVVDQDGVALTLLGLASCGDGPQFKGMIYVRKNCNAGDYTITINFSGTASASGTIDEWAGLNNCTLDVVQTNGGYSNAHGAAATGTLANAGEVALMLCCNVHNYFTATTPPTDGGTWRVVANDYKGPMGFIIGTCQLSSTASINPTFTGDATNYEQANVLVTMIPGPALPVPVLNAPTGYGSMSEDGAIVFVGTDSPSGEMFAVGYTGSNPTQAQILAGHDANDLPTAHGSAAVVDNGPGVVLHGGTAHTSYSYAFVQVNSGGTSDPLYSTDQFTTLYPGPNFTAPNGGNLRMGGTYTVTGLNFGASQGVGVVQLDDAYQVPQSIVSWSDTAITFNVVEGHIPCGPTKLRIMNNHLRLVEVDAVLLPPAGWKSVDLGAVTDIASELRIESVPPLESDDQVIYSGTSVLITDQGIVSFDPTVDAGFSGRVWRAGVGWGATRVVKFADQDPFYSKVVLLINGDTFNDAKGHEIDFLNGDGMQLTYEDPDFPNGGWIMRATQGGSIGRIQPDTSLDIGTGNFTLEFRFKALSKDVQFPCIWSYGKDANNISFLANHDLGGAGNTFFVINNDYPHFTHAAPVGVVQEVCIQRYNGTLYYFVNGQVVAQEVFAGALNTGTFGIVLGTSEGSLGAGDGFHGLFGKFRLTLDSRYPIEGYTPSSDLWPSGPQPLGASRYLRLRINRGQTPAGNKPTATGSLRISGLQFHTPDGAAYPIQPMTGASAPAPLVATASSSLGAGYEAWRAFDGTLSDASRWASTAGSTTDPEWLQIDLGPDESIVPGSVAIALDAANADYYPIDFDVLGSNTGAFAGEETTYFSVQNLTATDWAAGGNAYVTFDIPQQYPDSDPFWNQVALLINGDRVGDEKGHQVSNFGGTGVPVVFNDDAFAAGALKFDGTAGTGFLKVAAASDLDCGTQDFTFEWRFRPTSKNVQFPCAIEYGSGTTDIAFLPNHDFAPGGNGNSTFAINNVFPKFTHAAAVGDVHDYCLMRQGDTLYMFLDGKVVDTLDVTGQSFSTGTFGINFGTGGSGDSSEGIAGLFGKIRLTIGQARYSTVLGYTPNPWPFPIIGG